MIRLYFAIRVSDIPLLIGSNGSHIKPLEKKTNTSIGVRRDSRRDEGTLQQNFTKLQRVGIKGTKKDIAKALLEVTNTITSENDAPFLQLNILPGEQISGKDFKRPRDFYQLQADLSKKLDAINADLNARCQIVCLGPTGILGIEVLSNAEEEFEEAVIKVIDFFEAEGLLKQTSEMRRLMAKLGKKSIDEQVKNITSKEAIAFLVPYDKTTALIGHKGSTIKELEKKHDVSLAVESPGSEWCVVGRTVLIRGVIKNIGECLAELTARIFEDEDISPRVIILLPPGVPRYLIGHNGETIKQIETESGCSLVVKPGDIRINGSIAPREHSIEYCQISGKADTICKGVQGVAARILIKLDNQGVTSESSIPSGAKFGWFAKAVVAHKGEIGKNSKRAPHRRRSDIDDRSSRRSHNSPPRHRRDRDRPSKRRRVGSHSRERRGRVRSRERRERTSRGRPIDHHSSELRRAGPVSTVPHNRRSPTGRPYPVSTTSDLGRSSTGWYSSDVVVNDLSPPVIRPAALAPNGGWGTEPLPPIDSHRDEMLKPWQETLPFRDPWLEMVSRPPLNGDPWAEVDRRAARSRSRSRGRLPYY